MTQPHYGSPGGYKSQTFFSGAAGDTLIWSGGGRLNQILPLTVTTSGQQAVFYDSNVATSGGPFPASGHAVIGILPGSQAGASGAVAAAPAQTPIVLGTPFVSGLVVHTQSGGGPFTVFFSTERPQI